MITPAFPRLPAPRFQLRLSAFATAATLLIFPGTLPAASPLTPDQLRCEYLTNPMAVESTQPRLEWILHAPPEHRGWRQIAYQILVASHPAILNRDQGDLWDSTRVESDQTTQVPYQGLPLASGQACFWKVRVWDQHDLVSSWSHAAQWTMGLLKEQDWAAAQWISHHDDSPLHSDRQKLYLPAPRYYRRDFHSMPTLRRATLHATALGIFDLYLNGQKISQDWLAPGWSDYAQRAYYRSYDVTSLVRPGANTLGTILAEGWYSGYLGYGLLVGYGPHRVGRYFYGKTPAWRALLVLEYHDGSRAEIPTDTSWQVSAQGPLRQADLLMGETYDARLEQPGWAQPNWSNPHWEPAIRAEDNPSTPALYYDQGGQREINVGFTAPPRLQAYPAPPIRITQQLAPTRLLQPSPGIYIFDFGQNISGVVRLKLTGPSGTRVQLRHGEMLHPDGRLMTENLRRAQATDTYILRGDPQGETWNPRFTYHGFQYVELTGLENRPGLDTVTALVIHSATPLASRFECSDPVVNRLFQNIVWTQRANFFEVPTDCPQRDERFGWMGDAQIYVRTATCNADVASFFTKWLDDLQEAQRSFGAYPDYAPYPMQHGEPDKSFGTAWMDAGIICPWTIHQVYGDQRVLQRHYHSMTRFMEFRQAISPSFLGVSLGNPWGDWLNQNDPTPIEYIDACYYAHVCRLMADIAQTLGHSTQAAEYQRRFQLIQSAFQKAYVLDHGTLKESSQTAYVLALAFDLLPEPLRQTAANHLATLIEKNNGRMTTGFLGTKPLLPVLSAHGHHDLAIRLLQSRQFPSWCYEVVNGATTVWERWDSYTHEDGFGRHNAAMNSFSHYAFGAVCEWIFRSLVGIDTAQPGFQHLRIHPGPPSPGLAADPKPIDWVRAEYDSPHGSVGVAWHQTPALFQLDVTLPPNTTATVDLPARSPDSVTESGHPLPHAQHVTFLKMESGRAILKIPSGSYHFQSER